MKQLNLMLLIPDVARADIMLGEDRVYYAFSTEDAVDEGTLPGLHERMPLVGERIVSAIAAAEGEAPVPADRLRLSIFADNMVSKPAAVSVKSLSRVVDELERIDDAFIFLRAFVDHLN